MEEGWIAEAEEAAVVKMNKAGVGYIFSMLGLRNRRREWNEAFAG